MRSVISCAGRTSENLRREGPESRKARWRERWTLSPRPKRGGRTCDKPPAPQKPPRPPRPERHVNGNLEFQYPWVLALLVLLPGYALMLGRVGKLAALR